MRKGYLRILESPVFRTCSKILVACSGGPDSMATLDRALNKYGFKVEPIFIHHHTEESEQGTLALQKYIAHHTDSRLLTRHYTFIPKETLDTEAEWAYARRRIYKEYLHKYESSILITGHHLDDAVEEYLINIGKRGLSRTLKYNWPNRRIFRPMLINKKINFVQYCDKKEIGYIDSTEHDDLRNRIRKSPLVSTINDVLGTNIETIVRKKVHVDHELSTAEELGPSN